MNNNDLFDSVFSGDYSDEPIEIMGYTNMGSATGQAIHLGSSVVRQVYLGDIKLYDKDE